MSPVRAQVDEFVDVLTRVLRVALGPHATLAVTQVADTFVVGPDPVTGESWARLPMVRRGATEGLLELRVAYRLGLDEEREHLQVNTSAFGLWIAATQKKPRPAIRIEFDRQATAKAQAHVHIHAESTEIGWLYGAAGRPVPRTAELHIPLGGRRFRPTLEEFLWFIDSEGFFKDWADPSEFRTVLSNSFREWEKRQARATVRRHPEAAVQQLESMGYRVIPPGS